MTTCPKCKTEGVEFEVIHSGQPEKVYETVSRLLDRKKFNSAQYFQDITDEDPYIPNVMRCSECEFHFTPVDESCLDVRLYYVGCYHPQYDTLDTLPASDQVYGFEADYAFLGRGDTPWEAAVSSSDAKLSPLIDDGYYIDSLSRPLTLAAEGQFPDHFPFERRHLVAQYIDVTLLTF